MHALSSAELLAVWELAANQPPSRRALALLAGCAEEDSLSQLAELSIGQSDERLLGLRERTFGPRLAAISSCPACGLPLEFEMKIADLRLSANSQTSEPIYLESRDYQLHFRLPNNVDIASLDPEADNESNRRNLLRRCLLEAKQAGADVPADELPPEIMTAISDRMAEADPQADLQFALTCPACGHNWNATIDVPGFVWSEVNARAVGLLNDVHALASAYGWREADILSMSAARRQIYLELATQ